MNALSSLLPTSSTATPQRITNIGAFNKLFDAISDLDLYESDVEPKPHLGLIRHAADILSGVSLEGAEVAPFYREIDITWKANGIRVKATFGPDPGLFYVYRECFENGRVAFLEWLPTPSHASSSSFGGGLGAFFFAISQVHFGRVRCPFRPVEGLEG